MLREQVSSQLSPSERYMSLTVIFGTVLPQTLLGILAEACVDGLQGRRTGGPGLQLQGAANLDTAGTVCPCLKQSALYNQDGSKDEKQ
jgi:hypothetical protein